jgi:hypothetical protein
LPSDEINAGHEISIWPPAGLPSARYTTSFTTVVAGPAIACPTAIININATLAANTSVRPILLRAKQAKSPDFIWSSPKEKILWHRHSSLRTCLFPLLFPEYQFLPPFLPYPPQLYFPSFQSLRRKTIFFAS